MAFAKGICEMIVGGSSIELNNENLAFKYCIRNSYNLIHVHSINSIIRDIHELGDYCNLGKVYVYSYTRLNTLTYLYIIHQKLQVAMICLNLVL